MQYEGNGLLNREPFLGHAKVHEELERFHEKMAASAARIEHPELRSFFGPIRKSASGGSPRTRSRAVLASVTDVAHEAQMGEIVAAARLQVDQSPKFFLIDGSGSHLRAISENLARTPRTDGVMQEEEYHVALSEKLGHCGKFVGTDLLAARIDLGLPLGLPELVRPAQRIRSGEYCFRQGFVQPLELLPGLRRQREFQYRVVFTKDLRKHALGASTRERPRIHSLLASELPAVFQRQVDAFLGIGQESVLGQKASEKHAMPVLVRHLVSQTANLLDPGLAVPLVPHLTSVHPKPVAKRLVQQGHRLERPSAVDRERLKCLARARLSRPAGLPDDPCQQVAEVGREGGGHQAALMIRSRSSKSRLQCGHRARTRAGSIRPSNSLACLILW